MSSRVYDTELLPQESDNIDNDVSAIMHVQKNSLLKQQTITLTEIHFTNDLISHENQGSKDLT